ncbi:MAG: hypothetical protein AAF677_03140 [Pseudomonadota bacterium]
MLIVDVLDRRVRRRFEGKGAAIDLPLPAAGNGAAVAAAFADIFAGWIERYRRAAAAGAEPALRVLGAEIFAWLDQVRIPAHPVAHSNDIRSGVPGYPLL